MRSARVLRVQRPQPVEFNLKGIASRAMGDPRDWCNPSGTTAVEEETAAMFRNIPPRIEARMRYLERIDALDRTNGTPQQARLRQVPRVTGEFLALLAACCPSGKILEIGTSAGYSALWLSLACREKAATLTTFESSPEKARVAGETFKEAGIESMVEVVQGDALDHLPNHADVAFCFLDAEKEVYTDCFKLVVPRLVRGGLLVADNVISHQHALQSFSDIARADSRVDSVLVPIGNGLMICRTNSPQHAGRRVPHRPGATVHG